MGLDHRVGSAFLDAGLGWGGSCFPKDVRALEYMAATNGCHPQLLRAVMEINRDQRRHVVQRIRETVGGSVAGRRIGILGLSFKPNTDDLRDAPSLTIIRQLQNEGARVVAYDPVAMKNAERILKNVEFAATPYEAADGADALAILTEWNEFKQLDLQRVADVMEQPVIIDGRNIYEPAQVAALGFTYVSIGRLPIYQDAPRLTLLATA
jgi:UDPglucose 6-dehydrogenase